MNACPSIWCAWIGTRFVGWRKRNKDNADPPFDFAQGRLFGDDNQKGKDNGKCKMRGSLHCAAHDETVSSFGRDDELWGERKENSMTSFRREK